MGIVSLFRTIKEGINRLSVNHRQLYCLFVFVLMLVNTILLFTEKMSVTASLAFILLPLAIQMLLLAAVRRPGVMFLFLIPKIIIDAFQLVLLKLYGGSVIAVDMWLNLVTTNPTEAGELLWNIAPIMLFLICFYIPPIIFAIKSLKNKEAIASGFRRRALTCGSAMLVAGMLFLTIAKHSEHGFVVKYDLYPNNVIYNMNFAIEKLRKFRNYRNTSEDFRYNPVKSDTAKYGKREIYIFMLGETARAENWSLFGYERKTTPRVDTLQGVIKFPDALTKSNTTHKSVPMTLTPAGGDGAEMLYRCKSIVTLFKEAGFKTIYLTNHEYRQTFMEYYFKEADVAISVKDPVKNSHDYQMLEPLQKEIRSSTSNLFIIVHLYGSHFNYHQRYTREFAAYTPDIAVNISKKYKQELINSYDNSILSTDFMIDSVISMLRREDAASALLYASDHGEDLLDDKRNRFLHASPVPTAYQLQVPFIVWLSENYRESFPRKAAQLEANSTLAVSTTASIFPTMANLASISSEYVNEELALSSPEFKEVPRRYITDHDENVTLDKLMFTEYDYKEFEKRNIKLR